MKHKSLATWLALVLGGLGAHRFYTHGPKDLWAWLHIPFTLAGVAGLVRASNLGVDDKWSWFLIPVGGLTLAAAMLGGIVYGLMADDKWNARFNSGGNGASSGWGAVLGVIACLLVGGTLTMASFAYGFQRYFEFAHQEAKRMQGK
jgi:hypothetical protein